MADNFKYPDHALKTLSEVNELVQRAARGELIKLYSVVRTGLPAFAIFSIKPVQEDVDEYEVAVDRVYPLTPPESDSKVQGVTGRLNLRYGEISLLIGIRIPQSGDFYLLITNMPMPTQ